MKILQILEVFIKGRNHQTWPHDIVNSTPASPVLITPDTARGVTYSGGLLYLSDLEGKITKFNLTNMSNDGAEIKLKY